MGGYLWQTLEYSRDRIDVVVSKTLSDTGFFSDQLYRNFQKLHMCLLSSSKLADRPPTDRYRIGGRSTGVKEPECHPKIPLFDIKVILS